MRNSFTQDTTEFINFQKHNKLKLFRELGVSDTTPVKNSFVGIKQSCSFLRNVGRLTLLLCINFLLLNGTSAQTTETFESFSLGASSFTSSSVPFTLNPSSGFKVDVYSGYGYLSSNNFIDNLTSNTNPCQIKSTSTFSVKSLYLYPSTYAGGDYNQTSSVNVTFTGKLASVTKFTYSPPSSDFASASWSNTTNRGFSLVNFATPGYDNIAIDELEITLGGSTIYFAIDNFTWAVATANSAPTDIALSASSINENVAGNTSVGTLSTTDPDVGNTFTYSLVSGTGSTDNASFNISGSSLRITGSPDFETKSSYSVRVRTTDQGSLYFEKAYTITINDLNEAPTDISLSASSINENVVGNSTVGTLSSTDQDAANTFTYTLVAGTGSTDNASFNISGNSLRITNSPDYETKSSYSVRVRTTDQGSLLTEKAFTISINDLNEAPTDIALSASSINENVAGNSTVGTLSSTDPDAVNTFTYTLVVGTGSTDNASFIISGSSLRITNSPDYETKISYSVRVRTTDQGGVLYYEKAFTITINNVNETPTDISLSANSINENVVANSTIGTLSSTDPDAGNTFTYTLVVGTGDTDNASFNISGSSLRITNSPDFETKSSYSVRVRTTDQGSLIFDKVFTVTINDLNETPTDIALSASLINENVVANSTVGTLSSTDQDAANTFTYTLVAGTGSTDNASFNISGSSLRITGSPDFETKSSYSVRVRTTDQGTLFYEKDFTITINDLNETPTDISLSGSSINENVIANSTVGTLSSIDQDAANTFTYTLVAGTGSADNASFNISGSSLRITSSPDFEVKSSYSVRVRTTDQGSLTYEKAFTITINNVNETPTDIALSATLINENVVANSTVGTLSTTDTDAANTFTYTLVAGTGSTDNTSFNISGSSLHINSSPDFETKNSFSVRVRSTDQGSLWFEKVFIVTINDLNEAPSDITLSVSSINENVVANSIVGILSTTDQDISNTFTYTLVAGTGSTDNASFSISGSDLHITPCPDYETKSSYLVRILTTDQESLTYEKAFTITINDLNDEIPVVTASQSFNINENSIVGTIIGTVTATDNDAGSTFSSWTITVNANVDGDGTNAFDINPSTGQITVADADDFDRETNTSLTIKVTVSDGANTSVAEDVTINLTDLNDVAPVITASQVFYVTEQSPNGTAVGTVVATDEDVTPTTFQNWTITAGNSGGYFNINSSTGVITVMDNTGLNPAINPSFTLTLTVSDGTNTSSSQTVSIIVAAINDDNPVITASQSFSIDENLANSSAVGQVLATDSDYGTVFQDWAITDGNTSNAFAINISGELTVNTSSVLDFESVTSFALTIEVSDGLHSGSGVVTINLNNLNDNTPVITGETFSIDENSANGTVACDVNATDADGSLNDLVYSITLGNTNNAFAINSSNGEIIVNSNDELDFETTPVFNLTVQVSDGLNIDEANITINLNDLVETGIEENESSEINLYPNPANDELNILFNHNPSEQFIIEIVSIDGIKVYQGEIHNTTTKTIDLTEMPLGLYFIKIFNQKESFTKKLVVQ
ncbi:MAG: hypothetical protein A2041_03090 [Bacteroidetes bacterium GWA2_31_9b]|nr:MAG: hypothetical protein A2041_03090 [Bacteroidetes bacterium GWA2_31_9b]